MFSQREVSQFQEQGFIIVRKLADEEACENMLGSIRASLNPPLAPLEFETDVQYPGSPADRLSPGGDTPRRLLNAYTRDSSFRNWATSDQVVSKVRQLLDTDAIQVSQNHHNCIMTKHPGFSSATLWHQDIRYWRFDRPELVSVWFALGDERRDNGALLVIPGTHRSEFDPGRLDRDLFLRPELPENAALIEQTVPVELNAGDVLFFHCRVFHAAGKNTTEAVKLSPVFTYHDPDNSPIPGTRSAAFPSIALSDQPQR